MKKDCLFLIMGVTGNLSKLKLIPAIYHLFKNKKIYNIAIIGVARDNINSEKLLDESKRYIKNLDAKVWDKFKRLFYYFQGDFYDEKKFMELDGFSKKIEKKHNLSGNKIFYLATIPQHFETISNNLKKCGLAEEAGKNSKKQNWVRVVFEKPFGFDLKSAKKLDSHLGKVFSEDQIYHIDHYLGKELIQNISVIRFTNTILEPLWNNKYVDHVQIILSEDVGIEERGPFYDTYGVVKDVVQNHMLQMLALTAMESPMKLTEKYIRDEKVKLLRTIRTTKELVLGQHEDYRNIKGIDPNSKTATFAALKLFVDNSRWKGVPFYLISGKKMKEKITSIYIQFKQSPCLLFREMCDFQPNYLVIQIQPEEGFYIQMNGKVPDKPDIAAIKLDFCHSCTFGPNTPEAYETLLFDVAKGDQSVFVRSDEIEEEWRIVDSVLKNRPKLNIYKKGSYPSSADKLIKKDNKYWHLKVK